MAVAEVEDEEVNLVDAGGETDYATNANPDHRHARQALHSLSLMRSLLELEQAPPAGLECSSQEEDYGTGQARSLQEPLLPQEEQQQLQRQQSSHRFLPPRPQCNNIKLYIIFLLLVASGVSNVILVKLQSVPMYVNEN